MRMNIVIRAGARALAHIRKNGLRDDDIDLFAGASGGPKCLILNGFDREIFGSWFKNRKKVLHMLGSSIGCYRIAALAQRDPVGAVTRFIERYAIQSYSQKPGPREISDEARAIISDYVDDEALRYILEHPFMRASFITARCRGIGASDSFVALAPFFGAAYAANRVSRKALNLFFERVLFCDPRARLDTSLFPDVSTRAAELTTENFHSAILASGAIPFAMERVNDIPGTRGSFRDGGIIDYHFDLPFDRMVDGLTLYPHFFDELVPGWLDKKIRHRKPSAANYRNVVFVAPTREFISRLPNGKVPDRSDVAAYINDTEGRIALWRKVIEASRELGREFMESVNSGRIAGLIRPIEEIL